MKKKKETSPQFLKAGDAATACGISRRYLHDLTTAGRIPSYRISTRCICYSVKDLMDFMASVKVGGKVAE